MRKQVFYFLAFLMLFLLISCAPAEQDEKQTNYESTKKMMMDILQTDEGKQTIQKVINQDQLKEEIIIDHPLMKQTIEETLTSDKGTEFWQKAFSDPAFTSQFAKHFNEEHKKMMKELMTDPEYQALLIDVLKNPEVKKMTEDILKGKEYREELQQVISETLNSPLYQAKLIELMKKAKEEKKKPKEEASSSTE